MTELSSRWIGKTTEPMSAWERLLSQCCQHVFLNPEEESCAAFLHFPLPDYPGEHPMQAAHPIFPNINSQSGPKITCLVHLQLLERVVKISHVLTSYSYLDLWRGSLVAEQHKSSLGSGLSLVIKFFASHQGRCSDT